MANHARIDSHDGAENGGGAENDEAENDEGKNDEGAENDDGAENPTTSQTTRLGRRLRGISPAERTSWAFLFVITPCNLGY